MEDNEGSERGSCVDKPEPYRELMWQKCREAWH